MQLRPYQVECHDSEVNFIHKDKGHGIVVAECSAGKSLLIAWTAEHLASCKQRVVVLTDRSKLTMQNSSKLQQEHGIVSAGLGRFDYDADIVIGGIQTIYNKTDKLGRVDWILADECEAIGNNFQSETRYHQFLRAYPQARIIGYSATPYTLQEGAISWGKTIHEITYQQLLDAGFCTPLTNKVGDIPDLSGVKHSGEEYNITALAEYMSQESLIQKSAHKAASYFRATNRKKGLAFCVDVNHAFALGFELRKYGIKVDIVHGKMSEEKRQVVYQEFEHGETEILLNVELLTKGADFPCIDAVFCFRPTESMRLWFQMIGRGIRLFAGKTECYLFDFSGNLAKFGILGNPIYKYFGSEKKKVGKAQKICPSCETSINIGRSQCPVCDYIFLKEDVEKELKHDEQADLESDTSKPQSVERWYPVKSIYYCRHAGRDNKPDTLKVIYKLQNQKEEKEYKCFDHPRGSWANNAALKWASERGKVPRNIEEALVVCQEWKKPKAICVRPQKGNPKYTEICNYEW